MVDYSGYDHVCLMHHKSDSLEKFKEYKAGVENELESIWTCDSKTILIEHEIQSQLSTPNTHQQNDVLERRN